MRPHRIAANIALLCGSIALAIVLSEVALRLAGFRPAMLDRAMFKINPDSLLPFTLQPRYAGRYAGGLVTSDSEGNRAVRPRVRALGGPQQQNRAKTLLLLGDSQIFGQGLDDDQTTASQLQDSLYARGLNVHVVNIAAPGYTSWNEYAALRDYVSNHPVDEVVLSYMTNDPTFNNDYFGLAHGHFNDISESPFHRLTQVVYRRLYTAYLIGDAWRRLRAAIGHERSSLVPPDPAVVYSMRAINKIQQLCTDKGIAFSVGVYRDVSALTDPTDTRLYEQKITQALSQSGVDWFMLSSHIAHLTRSQAMVSWSDPHPSARATSFIVSDILNHIAAGRQRLTTR